MERIDWEPEDVCASSMTVWLDNGIIKKTEIIDSCDGNSQAIIRLIEGKPAAEVIALLKGIDCEGRGTSCPDQLAKALESYLKK